MSKFGEQLQRAMDAAGLKQGGLAEDIGLSQSTISRMVRGELQPSLAQLDQLAKACGVNRYALIGGTEIAANYPESTLVTLEPNAPIKWLGYFASALTGLSEPQREQLFAEAATVRAASEQIRAFLYEPRLFTDPVLHRDVSAERVYSIDQAQVSRSHFLVLHTSHTSFGAGQELEIAKNAGLPIVMLQAEGSVVSRMVRGTTAVLIEVPYARDQLAAALAIAWPSLAAALADRHTGAHGDAEITYGLAERIRAARKTARLDESKLAALVGLRRHGIEDLESGVDHSPGLPLLRRIAQVLRTSVSQLVDGTVERLEDVDPVVSQSRSNLDHLGTTDDVLHREAQQVWDEWLREYTQARLAVTEARSTAVSTQEWKQRLHVMRKGPAPRQHRLAVDD